MEPAIQQPTSHHQDFWQQTLFYLKKWPTLLNQLIQNPRQTIAKLPTEGTWHQPLTYLTTSATAAAILQLLWLNAIPEGSSFRLFWQSLGSTLVGYLFLTLVIQAALAVWKESPGIYRTGFFVGVLSVVAPAGVFLSWLHPILAIVANVWALFLIYRFAQTHGKLTKQEAMFFVLGLIVFGFVLSRFFLFAFF